jgi:hypothetical protein
VAAQQRRELVDHRHVDSHSEIDGLDACPAEIVQQRLDALGVGKPR